jgi:hypothetical protein
LHARWGLYFLYFFGISEVAINGDLYRAFMVTVAINGDPTAQGARR